MVGSGRFLQALCIALLGLGLTTTQVQAANVTTSVDRSIVQEGESLQLDLAANGDIDGTPDFSPLEKDFDILSRQHGSSMQFINGRVSRKTQWSLILMPKRLGKLQIPSIRVGREQSNPLTITVKSASTGQSGNTSQDIFMEVSATPEKAYVQAEIVYTIRVYLAVNINNASLSEPKLNDSDAVLEKLGEDKRYQTYQQGRRYQVVERNYAIFPQHSGSLKIEPILFTAQVLDQSQYMFAPFSQQGHTKRLRSKAIEVDIHPIPAQHNNGAWLPARDLSLQEQWPSEPPKFKVGEAVTRTLTLRAEGLTAAQLPELKLNTPDGFKSYPDQAKLDDQKDQTGITGQRQEKIAMIATRPGSYTLPAIKLNWWNTQTNKAEVAHIPARTITVLAAAGGTKPSVKNQPPAPITEQAPASVPAITTKPVVSADAGNNNSYWPWLSLFLGLGWLSTLVYLWYRSSKPQTHPKQSHANRQSETQTSLKQLEKKIKQACLANNAVACKQALLDWASQRYSHNTPTSLTALGKRFGGNLDHELSKLDQSLYGQAAEIWQGDALWQAWQQLTIRSDQNKADKEAVLQPLYP